MVKKKTKKVEFVRFDNADIDFGSLILAFFEQKMSFESPRTQKQIEIEYASQNGEEYILGVVSTTIKKDIPPKRNYQKRVTSDLGLGNEEGLAYGNAFLYIRSLRILMYEFNGHGTYLSDFVLSIQDWHNLQNTSKRVSFFFTIVLNVAAFEKMGKMKFIKKVEMKVSNPDALISETSSLGNLAKQTGELNGDYFKFEVGVSAKPNSPGLINQAVYKIAGIFADLGFGKENVEKFIISGVYEDPETHTTKKDFIDFVTDKFIGNFDLSIQKVASDIQVSERIAGIKHCYYESIVDLERLYK